jgi:hypothetical protein
MTKMKHTRTEIADVKAYLKDHGATLEIGEDGRLNLDLPAGRIWGANGLHTYVAWDRMEAIDAMKYGTRNCTATECDICEGL